MNISVEWLIEKNACVESILSFKNQGESDSLKILRLLIEGKNLDWASWLIVRVMNYQQSLSCAIFAAESVLDNFEKVYPHDKRSRRVIATAKKRLKNKETVPWDTESAAQAGDWLASIVLALEAGNVGRAEKSAEWAAERCAGWAAESAAWTLGNTAAIATWSARSAAKSAGWAAVIEAGSAGSGPLAAAIEAAFKAERRGWTAKSAAWTVASEKMQLKILNYGVKLLEGQIYANALA